MVSVENLEELLLQCKPVRNVGCVYKLFAFYLLKKSLEVLKRLHDIPFCFSLKRIPACHTYSRNISRNTRLPS